MNDKKSINNIPYRTWGLLPVKCPDKVHNFKLVSFSGYAYIVYAHALLKTSPRVLL